MNSGSERLAPPTWESEAGAGLEAGPPPVVAAGSGRALAEGSPWVGVGVSTKEGPVKLWHPLVIAFPCLSRLRTGPAALPDLCMGLLSWEEELWNPILSLPGPFLPRAHLLL